LSITTLFSCVDDDHRDKQMIVDAFKQHGKLKMLRLAPNKKKSLIDFLCRLPELIERTCSSSNIQHGFIEAGIIDKAKKRYPVFTKIIATCRRNPTIPEFRNILENFGYFLEAACENGYVPEELYDLYNVVQDTEAGGKVVLRISQEHMQRTKVLTHESQVQLRKERILASQKSERAKKERENAMHQDKIDANQEVVNLLYDMLDKKGLLTDEEKEDLKEEYLEICTLDMFDDILGDMQPHFILAHQDMEKPVFVTKSSLPKKGTLEEAREEKAYTKTRIAFDCRTVPNCLLGRHPHDLSEDVMMEEQEQSPAWRVLLISLADEEEVLPSKLLSNELWVEYVVNLFDLDKLGVGLEVSEEDKTKADLLVKMLRERFHEHLKQRIKDKARRTHWSMKLAYKNLAVDAALMVLSNHSAQYLECLGDSDSLLNTGVNCFIPGMRFPDRQGAYLYRDNNRGKIIRSGKKTRGGIVGRHKEHLKAAKAKKATSNFYNLYPSELSPRKTNRNKKGYFEGLSLLIAAAFDHTSDNAMNLEKDWNEGGLLILSEDDKRSIKESMNSSNLTPIQKFHDIVAYQVELGYDLAIEPSLNVSRSPGFESVLGIFGGQE